MKTSLGIWAFGPMVTRFVPVGYKPDNSSHTTVDMVEKAVTGLGDLVDGYEFHYPQELSSENLDAVRRALGSHDIYCVASGLHLDPVYVSCYNLIMLMKIMIFTHTIGCFWYSPSHYYLQ